MAPFRRLLQSGIHPFWHIPSRSNSADLLPSTSDWIYALPMNKTGPLKSPIFYSNPVKDRSLKGDNNRNPSHHILPVTNSTSFVSPGSYFVAFSKHKSASSRLYVFTRMTPFKNQAIPDSGSSSSALLQLSIASAS